ncbi:MAG: hypothetical protein FD138_2307 [Planctomycetota bacterium]|nr:MAG: hypothetical protein FD138_2307 [Planctomycetota bacterium]
MPATEFAPSRVGRHLPVVSDDHLRPPTLQHRADESLIVRAVFRQEDPTRAIKRLNFSAARCFVAGDRLTGIVDPFRTIQRASLDDDGELAATSQFTGDCDFTSQHPRQTPADRKS